MRYAINIKKFVLNLREVFSLTRQALSGKEYDYTNGSIRRAVVLLAIPMVLELSMESVFAITDIFFVSGLGAEAVATVGLTEAVITLLYAVAVGLSMAVTAMVARRIGEKDPESACVVAGQTIWIGVGVAILVGTLGIAHAENILRFMGAEDAVVAMGSDYTAIMLGGSVTILYLFLFNAIYRGAGNPGIAMRSLWLANGINIILDPCLIYGIGPFPEMGVTGAAIATNIGRGVGVLYQLYHLFDGSSVIRLQLRHLAIVPSVMLRLLKLSVGGVSQFLIATASWVVLMRLVSGYGSTAVAGYTIAIRIVDLTILPAWGMSNAAATLVGQNLGALKPERAEQSVMKIMKYNFMFLVTVAIIFMIFAETLISFFTHDAMIIAYGSDCLRYISYGYGLFAVGMVLIQAFNGAGDTFTPTRINLLCFWIVQIPVAFVLAEFFGLGPTGVFLAITVTESLVALIAYLEFRKGTWKLKVV
jgi:putative MATE family efflux protein